MKCYLPVCCESKITGTLLYFCISVNGGIAWSDVITIANAVIGVILLILLYDTCCNWSIYEHFNGYDHIKGIIAEQHIYMHE